MDLASENYLHVNERNIYYCNRKKITDVPWAEYGVDLVIDSSGMKANLELMYSENHGVKNFIVTNSPEGFDQIKTIVFGANEHECDPKNSLVFSSSICDTVALCPLLNIISQISTINSGFLTTLHPWLSYQNLLDGPSVSWSQPGDVYSHYALGRASSQSVIPKSTSVLSAAGKIYPELSSKISSFSYRIPTEIVSSGNLTLSLKNKVDKEDIEREFKNFAERQVHSILSNSSAPLTSVDYKMSEYSIIVDHRWTQVIDDNNVRFVYWYDNEWGYSARVVDLAKLITAFY